MNSKLSVFLLESCLLQSSNLIYKMPLWLLITEEIIISPRTDQIKGCKSKKSCPQECIVHNYFFLITKPMPETFFQFSMHLLFGLFQQCYSKCRFSSDKMWNQSYSKMLKSILEWDLKFLCPWKDGSDNSKSSKL